MSTRPTVYDVAEKAGVSIATVSRVLTTPSAVREGTRERVLSAVAELGYVPSGSARGLAAKRTDVVGLFLPDRDDTVEAEEPIPVFASGDEVRVVVDSDEAPPRSPGLYFDEVLRGAETEAWRRGFGLMIAAARSGASPATSIASRVDALAVFAGTLDDATVAHIARRIPVVVLAGAGGPDSVDHIGANNVEGMRALVRQILTRAPRTLVYLDGPAGSPDAADRLAGFHAALGDDSASGRDSRPAVVFERGDFTRSSGREAVDRILAAGLPEVIVCANDQMALGVLDALAEAGIEVPGRVQVTGFDGIEAGRLSKPRLTTVHQPMHELGRLAVSTLVERLADPARPARSLTLPVEVLLRGSTR